MKKYKSYPELAKDSVEWWAKALSEEKTERLQTDDAELILILSLNESDIEQDSDGVFQQQLGGWNTISILHSRLQMHTFTMSKAAIWACSLLVSTPGEAVIMLNYFQYRCHSRGIRHIDMKALCQHMIPNGWFPKKTLEHYWDKQKFISKEQNLLNMLDYPVYAESIRLFNWRTKNITDEMLSEDDYENRN